VGFWPFKRKSGPTDSGQLIGALLANQVGLLPELFVSVYERSRTSGATLPTLSEQARARMWQEIGAFYTFLAACALAKNLQVFQVARGAFYELLQTSALPVGEGRILSLPALSPAQVAEFHSLVMRRATEYDARLGSGGLNPSDPANPLTTTFAQNVFGTAEAAKRIDLLRDLHVNMLQFVAFVAQQS
jgi:hypothetical protein